METSPVTRARQVLVRAIGFTPQSSNSQLRLSHETANQLVAQARSQRVLGPLASALERGVVELPDDVRQRALNAHEAALWWCLELEHRLIEVRRQFQAAGGVDHLVVKGPAVAHLDAPDPACRTFADIDLLVASRHLDQAVSILIEMGAVRTNPARRPGFDQRFVKGIGTTFDDGVGVDLHRTLCGGAHGFRIPIERMFASAEPFDIGGHQFLAPGRVHRFLHACYHAVIDSNQFPLHTLHDLARYLCGANPIPVEEAVAEARVWRGEAVLAEAVAATIYTFNLDVPAWSQWLNTRPVERAEHRLLAQQRSPTLVPVHWSTVRELTWPDRARFLWAVAAPSREVLEARGQTRITRLVQAAGRTLPNWRRWHRQT